MMILNISKVRLKMDNNNLIFEKVWQDEELCELKITAFSQYVNAYQFCYVEKNFLQEISEIILNYIKNYSKECYIELGKKEGDFTPAFSMKFLPADIYGHVKIEVDLEIADNETRIHRCCFFVESELGLIEKIGKRFLILEDSDLGSVCALNEQKLDCND